MRVSLRRLKEMITKEVQSEAGERKRPMVKPASGGYHVRKEGPVKGYWQEDEDGSRIWIPAHEEDSDTLALDYATEKLNPKSDHDVTDECDKTGLDEKKKRKKKKKKEFHASAGSVAALRDSGDSCGKAIEAGKFDWAGKGKWAACQSAHIVATGKPTVPQGAHFAGGQGSGGGGEGSHMVRPRKKGKR